MGNVSMCAISVVDQYSKSKEMIPHTPLPLNQNNHRNN